MYQAVLRPNLTKKFQWEVSQIADKRFSCAMLLGGLSVNLNHLNNWWLASHLIGWFHLFAPKFWAGGGDL